jgi:hypothetical protein
VAQLPTASPVCSALTQLRCNFYLWELDIVVAPRQTRIELVAFCQFSVSFDSYVGELDSIRPIVETKRMVAAALCGTSLNGEELQPSISFPP